MSTLTQEEKIIVTNRAKKMWEDNTDPKMSFGLEDLYQRHRSQLVMNYPPLNNKDQLINTLTNATHKLNVLTGQSLLDHKFVQSINEMEAVIDFMGHVIKEYRRKTNESKSSN